MPWIRRLHLFELNDFNFVPSFIRSRVQTCLTLLWVFRVPFLQSSSPAALVSTTLKRLLGPRISRFTFVDFCAGAGGPTPFIEGELNRLLLSSNPASANASKSGSDSARIAGRTVSPGASTGTRTPKSPHGGLTNGRSHAAVGKDGAAASLTTADQRRPSSSGVDFVLTDILPHRVAWSRASAQSSHLHYVASPVDAANAPSTLLHDVTVSPLASADTAESIYRQKPFRLFFLAFHHMDDDAARSILRNTLETADGFGVFELQGRTPGELVMVCLIWPLLWLISPFYFWRDPVMLFWMYVIPVIPFVLVFDGIVSCLRTRTGGEIMTLMRESGVHAGNWTFREGDEWHTWPIGRMRWFVGVKNED